MDQAVQQQIIKATEIIESQVDAEIHRLDNIDSDELEILRRSRLANLKKQREQEDEWRRIGHGEYTEIPAEKDFFGECKKSTNVVCHFYRDSTERCKIVDKHLALLAPKHVETRFLKINAEKCPFLAERLRIVVIPTIALIKEGKTKDYIVGFDDLGGRDDFPTEMMEWRLGVAEVINYSGGAEPPMAGQGSRGNKAADLLGRRNQKIIKGGRDDSDSDLD
ncbi:thioredoxin domain-containing protein 9-like [Diadema antillarum]|uniref:thioredoxin domain-containing protein 9-like n=1 Tax=Diadema antillarum TaxID=105358 RepID=UPI003A8B7FCC